MANNIEQVFRYLLPTVTARQIQLKASSPFFPDWAPDAFGICGYVLEITAGYHQVLRKGWPPKDNWDEFISTNALDWFSSERLPDVLRKAWNRILEKGKVKIADIKEKPEDHEELLIDLLLICIVADELMKNIFIAYESDDKTGSLALLRWVPNFFERKTLNKDLDPTIALVVPKNLTPQVGMSFRSISNNVGLWTDLEVEPRWDPIGLSAIRDSTKDLHVLVIPWPYAVDSSSFHPIKDPDIKLAPGYAYFFYSPVDNKDFLIRHVEMLIDKAETIVGPVDGVIFPELSMSVSTYNALTETLKTKVGFAICGVENKGANELRLMYTFAGGNGVINATQKKHHRWKVDSRQIKQYGLGKQLSVDKEWWENTPIYKRSLKMFQINPNLMATAIICEDLARQDPVAKLIRTMGPNLVFALLMDGPQLPQRWSGQYASVLADDPGSSVLTVTSLGMCLKSERRDGISKPLRNIALWRDSLRGTQLIDLKEEHEAVLLHLSFQTSMQNTADRRKAEKRYFPVLEEVSQISIK